MEEQLAPYVLQNVQGLKPESTDNLESGAYGVVFQVEVNGLQCMAKRLHAILVKDVPKEDKHNIEMRFRNECVLLSKLRHPNIVRFIGVCYLESNTDLVLVMEKLHMDLAVFVRKKPKAPIPIKTSIALDVSYGLLYLHSHNPPVIHRDLTAPNILLTRDIRAKIGDLGVSKVLSNPQLVTKTGAPGNANYMPPETKIENPRYGPAMDVFSFGHLLLHMTIQDWPPVFASDDHEALQQGKMELARRKRALELMGGDQNPFHSLVVDCLHDYPETRPLTVDLNKRLADLCTHQYPKTFRDILEVTDEEEKSHLTGVSEEQPRQNEILLAQLEELKTIRDTLTADKAALTKRLEEQSKLAEQELSTLTAERNTLNKECENLKKGNLQLRQDMEKDRERLETTIADTSRLHDQVLAKSAKVAQEKKRAEKANTRLAESKNEVAVSQKILTQLQETMQTREEEHEDMVTQLTEDKWLLEGERTALVQELEKSVQLSQQRIEKALTEFQQQVTTLTQQYSTYKDPNQIVDRDHLNSAPNLPGVEVLVHTSLIITQTAQSFKWSGYGLEIIIPPNSLPQDITHCVLQIYLSLAGQYQLPDNHQELVSPVYWIRPVPYCKFSQPLTLQIQHCAKKCFHKSLQFLRASCTQQNLPYNFTELKGGSFSEESRFGSIKLERFSGFTIAAEGPVERLYTAGLYYIGQRPQSWEIHLVVNSDSEPINSIVGQHYRRRNALEGPYIPLEFEEDHVTLDIPMEGKLVGNWTIRPLVTPLLTRRNVDYFRRGCKIPHCRLSARFRADQPAMDVLEYGLSLQGAKKPNLLVIEIDPQQRPRYELRGPPLPDPAPTLDQLMEHTGVTDADLDQQPSQETLSLIAPHIHNWHSYAHALLLTPQQIREIATNVNLGEGMKALVMLKSWCRRVGFMAQYRKLVEVCLRLDDAELAERVCRLLLGQPH